jgi:hypothetical protein
MNDVLDTVTLERMHLAVSKHVDPAMLNASNLEFNGYVDQLVKTLVITLNAHLASEKLEEVTYRWCESWWEALKKQYAPYWFTDRWPVCYVVKSHSVAAVYPTLSFPHLPHKIVVRKYDGMIPR